MAFELPALPYAMNALEPYISERTMEFHYGKHHKAYVDNLNKLIAGTHFEQMSLEEIIRKTAGKTEYAGIFNNAAQAWNHAFFWTCMQPGGGGEPTGEMKKKIERSFGGYDKFREEFAAAATTQFGSGWAWVVNDNGIIKIIKTANADTPVAQGLKPLITIDVWEHAYYLDFQNRRADFVEGFLDNLVNWPEL